MALYIAYRRIYGMFLPHLQRQVRHGRIFHRLRAMSGSAGLHLQKSQKRERIALRGRVRNLSRGFTGLAAGQAVLIVELPNFKRANGSFFHFTPLSCYRKHIHHYDNTALWTNLCYISNGIEEGTALCLNIYRFAFFASHKG